MQKVAAPSIAQIEKLIGELQEAKNLLDSEGDRIQREMVRYIKFAQLASASPLAQIRNTGQRQHRFAWPVL